MATFTLFTSIRYDPILLQAPEHENLNTTEWNHKVASPWYMLDYHRDRMLKAAKHFGWELAIKKIEGPEGLQRLEDLLEPFTKTAGSNPRRVKITLDINGNLDYEFGPANPTSLYNLFPGYFPVPAGETGAHKNELTETAPMKQPEYEVLIDSENTPQSEFTHHKTTRRQMYDDARKRHHLSATDLKEVLLVNPKDGSVMEATLRTPFFWRNGRWVTPPVSESLQDGAGSGGNNGTTRRWVLERYVMPQFQGNSTGLLMTRRLEALPWKRLFLLIASGMERSVGSATVCEGSHLEGSSCKRLVLHNFSARLIECGMLVFGGHFCKFHCRKSRGHNLPANLYS